MSNNSTESTTPKDRQCSKYLHKILRTFYKLGRNNYIAKEEALKLTGRSFPFVVEGSERPSRNWVEFVNGRGFRITIKGMKDYQSWEEANIYRTAPITHFAAALQNIRGLAGEFRIKEDAQAKPVPPRKPATNVYRIEHQQRRKSA
jgi:hypothetical protein